MVGKSCGVLRQTLPALNVRVHSVGRRYYNDRLFSLHQGSSPNYIKEMTSSIFCLAPLGYAVWNFRLFESIIMGCIPVIIADNIELPFEKDVDYRQFTVKVCPSDSPGRRVRAPRTPHAMLYSWVVAPLLRLTQHRLWRRSWRRRCTTSKTSCCRYPKLTSKRSRRHCGCDLFDAALNADACACVPVLISDTTRSWLT